MTPPDARGDAAWTDPERPPGWGRDLAKLGDGVWSVWLDDSPDHPHIWHWCNRSVRNAKPGVTHDREPGWGLAGSPDHDLISRDPLHLEPSFYLPDCCGLHGFIRDGKWVGA